MDKKVTVRRVTSAGYRLPERPSALASQSAVSVSRHRPSPKQSTGEPPRSDTDSRDPVKVDQIWREFVLAERAGVKECFKYTGLDSKSRFNRLVKEQLNQEVQRSTPGFRFTCPVSAMSSSHHQGESTQPEPNPGPDFVISGPWIGHFLDFSTSVYYTREKNWSFLKEFDQLGRPRTEPPPPSQVPLFSDTLPNTTNQTFGSRLCSELGKELMRMDKLMLMTATCRKTKRSPEMQPC